MSSESKAIRLEKSEGIAEVVLMGPGKGNAMGPDFWREMPEVFAQLDGDDEVRAVIVRGDGKQFSYGLDLAAMMAGLGQHFTGANLAAERTAMLDMVMQMQQAFDAIE